MEAAARVPDAQFLFMGGEPARDRRAAARRPRPGGALRVRGQAPAAELPAFLALADVLVSPRLQRRRTRPSRSTPTWPSGKPLVATRIPSHTQLLDDTLAFLVEPSAEGLAEGMTRALADRAQAQAKAAAGQALVEREYSAARYAEKVAGAYAAVAEGVRS